MSDTKITSIKYRTVYDSRGVETLEVDMTTQAGFARVGAPFGAPGSRGEFECPAYAPGGLPELIKILEKTIIPALIGMDTMEQEKIDALLQQIDGTANFEGIGGNTSTVLSTATAKVAADSLKIPLYRLLGAEGKFSLPCPLGNVIGGGAHSLGPAPDMQEHMVLPIGAKTVREAIETNLKVHRRAGKLLEKKDSGFSGGMDDEDAWAANLNDVEALEIIMDAKKQIEDEVGFKIGMGIDLAADRFWNGEKKKYVYEREGAERTTEEQLAFVGGLIERFELTYCEDAFRSSDYASFAALNKGWGTHCVICADDIYASNPARTQVGIDQNCARAMIVKPNQVGTISGARKTAALGTANGVRPIISNRSGETPDDLISHLAVAWNAASIKAGVRGGARMVKLNELIRIEQQDGDIKMVPWVA